MSLKDSYWFRHDSSSGRGHKIRQIHHQFGHWGKGIYWDVIEVLRDKSGYMYLQDEASLSLLCSLIGCNEFPSKNLANVARQVLKMHDDADGNTPTVEQWRQTIKTLREIVNEQPVDVFIRWFKECMNAQLFETVADKPAYFHCPPLTENMKIWETKKKNRIKTGTVTESERNGNGIGTESERNPNGGGKKGANNGTRTEPERNDHIYSTVQNSTVQNSTEEKGLIDNLPRIISCLNKYAGKEYKGGGVGEMGAATKRVLMARLREGWQLSDFEAVIIDKCTKWGNDPKMKEYLRPSTLFGTKFESYRNAITSTNGIVNQKQAKNVIIDSDPDLKEIESFYVTQMTIKQKTEYINSKRASRGEPLLPNTATEMPPAATIIPKSGTAPTNGDNNVPNAK